MNEKLEQLNFAAIETARNDFLNCCGSNNWARLMVEERPFASISDLLDKAEQIWLNLDAEDWLEAFAAHPKIGEKKSAAPQSARFSEWSSAEQSGAKNAADATRDELAKINRLYEEKFGFIFIVCATGKTATQMLDFCRERLNNDRDAEIQIAADEQEKITEIRLKKLLEIE